MKKNREESDLTKYFKSKPLISVPAKKIIISPNESLAQVYYIHRGNIRQYGVTNLGEEINLHYHGPGSFVPLLLILGEISSRYTFETLDEAMLYKASTNDVLDLINNDSRLLKFFVSKFANAAEGLAKRIELASQHRQSDQVLELLKYFGSKYGKKDKKGTVINFKLTHQDLANWLGVARETVTRQLKSLEISGQISYKKQIYCIHSYK